MSWARRWTRRSQADDGYTLVEIVVAVGVLGIVMLPLASVFYWSATADAANRENGDAIAIANGFLAKANAISYADLGFYENQFGTPPLTIPSYNGQPAVDLGASPAAGDSAQVPVTSTPEQVGTVVYSEHTYVVWVNGSGGKSYAYKQVYAVVSWPESGHTAQIVQSVLVYPGGLGTYTGPENNAPSGTTGTPDNVSGLSASVPADPAGETEVNLSWDAPQDPTGFYAAVWAPSQSDLATPATSGTDGSWKPAVATNASAQILGSATSYTVTGLAPTTSYWFEIVAFSSDGVQWAISQTWVNATTLTPPVQPCTLNTLSVSQSGQSAGQALVAKSNGYLMAAISITVTYSGSCTSGSDTVKVSATSSGSDSGSPYTLTWGASQYTYTLCPAAGFSTGTHTYTVTHNGGSTSLTAQVAFTKDNHGTPAC
jgi:type II secretory pathway pseudopilin PulG